MGTTGLALSLGAMRRRLSSRLHVEEDYLQAAGQRLRSRHAWRSFAAEQRVLVHDLPVLETRLSEIEAPTVIVVGAEDRVLPAGSAQKLAGQIPHARMSVLDRVGHLLPLLAPRRLAEVILAAAP
jgi:pimeloyl-ACP methyl ester carboxylesterase